MQDLNNKINDGGATADGVLPAEQWNEMATEAQNLITSSGQTLSGADLQQIAKAVTHYSANGNNYTVGGTANAITLSPVGAMLAPSAYSDGMEVRFEAANSNSGATTINVNGIGVVSLLNYAAGALQSGQIQSGRRYVATYRSTSSAFVLSDPSATYSIATNGYMFMPSIYGGLIIQWGTNNIAGNTATNVTLPLTFPNAFYNVQATYKSNSTTILDAIAANIVDTATIKLANGADSATDICWFAIGY